MGKGSVRQIESKGIAVIGIAARLPGAEDIAQFWQNLLNKRCSVREIPADRWDAAQYYSPAPHDINKSVSKWGGFIDGVDLFDPLFFGISPREARVMDPQQRIALELAWACIEDAGYAQEALRGSQTGVFLGVMNFDYRERLTEALGPIAGHMSTGAYTALIPNRISYHFDWHGPSMPIDTACSSSLVALHQAVHALQRGECELALTGGVSVLCSPTHFVSFSKTGMLSPDGLCRTFDDRANGYVRAEGAALALLKPLAQACRDGDHIYGVIRGTAVNHGGKVRTVTYPNPLAQADVITSAYEQAGIAPDTVSYIEAHGTGTPKGDPIEISGLKTAFARLAGRFACQLHAHSCGLGSLKANVGHLEPVAGIAGIIKVLLAMQHQTLPGLAHFQHLNHRIDLSGSPFHIVEQSTPWPAGRDKDGRILPRRAGVSSFGFGGVNGHAVLEEYLLPEEAPCALSAQAAAVAGLILLSAKTTERLQVLAQRLLAWLQKPQLPELAQIAYTLQVGRNALEQRLALSVHSVDELRQKLADWLSGRSRIEGLYQGQASDTEQSLQASAEGARKVLADWHAKLPELWVHGLAIDWKAMYGDHPPRRISLPSYPFARESYWVAAPVVTHSGVPAGTTAHSPPAAAEGDLLYFEERWVEEKLRTGQERPVHTVLCFASQAATRAQVRTWLAQLPQPVLPLFVAAGGQAGAGEEALFQVENDEHSFFQALQQVVEKHGKVDAVWYLWPLEDADYIRACAPILFLLQAAGRSRVTQGPILLAAQGDDGEQRCYWESWIGFERSAANALAATPVAAVYQSAAAVPDQAGWAQWMQILWGETQAAAIHSSLHKNGIRQVCRLRPLAVPGGLLLPPLQSVLRQGGTYLITGGLGGLGSLFADHLLRHYAAQVVLLGRTALDKSRQRKLENLAGTGGKVLYLQTDVSDPAQMAQALASVKQSFGQVHGVLHAAGVENWQSLQDTRWSDFEGVLAPKVAGTLVLEQVLQHEALDFLCYFSSSAAILGDFGGCSYAVGNRFQMAHARLRQEQGLPGKTLAINWPLWKDGGMRVGDRQRTQFYLQSTGQDLLQAGEGLAAFEALLARPEHQYLVMAGEGARIRRLLKLDLDPAQPQPTAPSALPSAPSSAQPSAAPPLAPGDAPELPLIQRIEQDLLHLASELLQVESARLRLDRGLAEFGFDSINLGGFATALSRRYHLEVLPSLFFSYPTLESLARYFLHKHAALMQDFYRARSPQASAVSAPAVVSVPAAPASVTQVASQPPAAAAPQADPDSIAVIGISGRFPGADDVAAMWRILEQGLSVVGPVDGQRGCGWEQAEQEGVQAGMLSAVDEFDSLFFEISPREAENMDPRQRLLLQEVWHALEDAGYAPSHLAQRSVGTFIGVEEGDYHLLTRGAAGGEATLTSNHNGILAGRIAYFLNLNGPALAINTACSSGLVALHQACQSLRNQECDTALVAAVNLMLTTSLYREMQAAGMLSNQGRSYAFDARADGMVPAEAVVALVLKKTSQALHDQDRIHALIRGSGINSDGRTNGITAPNGAAQASLIESVYRRHQINPAQIGYVIAHGTATRLGDPVEVNALRQAFQSFPSCAARLGECALTSVKPNFGHALAASGLLSVVAMIQAMQHQMIPASLFAEQPNPYIAWQDSPFFVNHSSRPWPRQSNQPRLGALSAFGMSGTNAHLVLQEAPPTVPRAQMAAPGAYLLLLSARSAVALAAQRTALAAYLENLGPEVSLADVAYTLAARRHHFRQRCALVVSDAANAVQVLRTQAAQNYVEGKAASDFRASGAQLQVLASLQTRAAEANNSQQLAHTLAELAQMYCAGHSLDGARWMADSQARLCSLPAYPFAKVRHWVRGTEMAQVAELPPPAPAVATAPVMSHQPHLSNQPHLSPLPPMPTLAAQPEQGSNLLLHPIWDSVEEGEEVAAIEQIGKGRLLLIGAGPMLENQARALDPQALLLPPGVLAGAGALRQQLQGQGFFQHLLWCVPAAALQQEPEALLAAQEQGVLAGLRLIQDLFDLGYAGQALELSVLTVRAQAIGAGDQLDATHAGVHGLFGALAKERPNWRIRLLDVPAPEAVPLAQLLAQPADRRGHARVFRHGQWYRRHLARVGAQGEYRAPYRRHGVYLVVGGAGDIGQAWTEHLIRNYQAQVIWVGRRAPDAELAARLQQLARLGPAPQYIAADAADLAQMQALREGLLAQYGALHGVVHAAMVFANQELGQISEAQMRAVLRAKLDVSVRIGQVFAGDGLDFVLLFSSMVSLIKNPRQAHYAAGCVFKDAYARQLAQQLRCPVKIMNWGYWGAQKNADAGEVQKLAQLGLGLIAAEHGMQALDVLLGGALPQLGLMRLTGELEIEGLHPDETLELYPPATLQQSP